LNTTILAAQCGQLIENYWKSFSEGLAHNYFLNSTYYQSHDTWAVERNWLDAANYCLSKSINEYQAYEILLRLNAAKYFDSAHAFVQGWYEAGAHDAYYMFDIVSRFPKENKYRSEFLGESNFVEFMAVEEGWGWNKLARQALIRADDAEFCSFLGDWLDTETSRSTKDEMLESQCLPLLLELGEKADKYISDDTTGILKSLVQRYLENDRQYVQDTLNSVPVIRSERSLWIVDQIAEISMRMGWTDIIDELVSSDWYWLAQTELSFDDDSSKLNLLSLSLVSQDQFLKQQAKSYVEHGHLEGAIAWARMDAKVCA